MTVVTPTHQISQAGVSLLTTGQYVSICMFLFIFSFRNKDHLVLTYLYFIYQMNGTISIYLIFLHNKK